VSRQNTKYAHLKTVVFPQFHMLESMTGPIDGFLTDVTYMKYFFPTIAVG